MQDLISIIIPAYNCENYIYECLNSIINQTYKNLEIIVLNDGSTDNTLKILNEIKNNDSRVKVIDKKNTGVSNTRNEGIVQAKGKYITFVDSDDFLEADFIEQLYNCIIENDVDVVRCNYYFIKNNKKEVRKLNNIKYEKYDSSNKSEAILKFLLSDKGNENYVMLLMIKNDENKVFFDEDLIYMEDVIYYFELLTTKKSIYFLDKELYNYRSNESSVTNSANKNLKLIEQLFDVRKILFEKLDKSSISDIVTIKKYFNGKLLKIMCVRFGRCVRTGMKYKEFKSIINSYNDRIDELLKNFCMGELNKIEKIQFYLFKSKKQWLLYTFYRVKRVIFKLSNKLR